MSTGIEASQTWIRFGYPEILAVGTRPSQIHLSAPISSICEGEKTHTYLPGFSIFLSLLGGGAVVVVGGIYQTNIISLNLHD